MTRVILFYILLISLIFTWTTRLRAQGIIISARVLDRSSEKPVSFAHVAIQGTSKGTTTNKDGFFRLNFDEDRRVELRITSIGYQTLKIRAEETAQLNNRVIYLEAALIELEEVVITSTPETARDIVEKAVSRISENYPKKQYFITGYYKESENTDGAPIYLAEAIVHARVPADISDDGIKTWVLKSRKIDFRKDVKFNNKITPAGFYWRIRNSIVDPIEPMQIRKIKHYSYSIKGYNKFDGKDIIIIAFTDGHKRQPHSGQFTIDLESYAFVRIEQYKIHGPGMPTDDWKWTHKSIDEQFTPDDNGKWHMTSSIFVGDWIKKKTKQEFQNVRLFIPTGRSDIDEFFNRGQEFDREMELYYNASDLDSKFWESFNHLELTAVELEALERIQQVRKDSN